MEGGGQGNTKRSQKRRSPWWDYPKFGRSRLRVLLINLGHLLINEVREALTRLGHEVRVVLVEGKELDRAAVEKGFAEALKDFQPDFLMTINHRGFDREGVMTDLLGRWRIPFASWYVDSPHLILHHYAENRSPWLTLFVWDRDYVEILSHLGFERVEYLPLGVDDLLFQPREGRNPFSDLHPSAVGFVGNSMVIKVRSILGRTGISGLLLDRFEAVSEAFSSSPDLIVRELLAERYPDLLSEMLKLSEPQALGYEEAVTWHATGRYRAERVKRLAPFRPVIAGDPGWAEILGDPFQLRRELNYYSDLPFFYNACRVNFNATSRQMKEGVNQRVFDVPACGRVVVTDHTRQLEELMEPGREVLAYRDPEEIPGLVERALNDGPFYDAMAEAGYERALSEHTYCHRIKRLVDAMRRNHG